MFKMSEWRFPEVAKASTASDSAKLVVEIKPDNDNMGPALCAIFRRDNKLISAVAAVISFDLDCIHRFNRLFSELKEKLVGAEEIVFPKVLFLTCEVSERSE